MKRSVSSACAACILMTFLLGVKNGQVAIWHTESARLLRVLPWPSSVLPAQVQQALNNGIRIEEDSDVGKLILQMIS